MRTSGDAAPKEDTSTTTYAGGIVVACILALIAIRVGIIGKGVK